MDNRKKKIIIYLCLGGLLAFSLSLFLLVVSEGEHPGEIASLSTAGGHTLTLDEMKQMNKEEGGGVGVFSQRGAEEEPRGERPFDREDVYEKESAEMADLQEAVRNLTEAKKISTGKTPVSEVGEEEEKEQETTGLSAPGRPIEPKQMNARSEGELKEPLSPANESTEEPGADVEEEPVSGEQPANRFFKVGKRVPKGNMVTGIVHGTQTVTDKSTLKMRLAEDWKTRDGVKVSKGTYVYGVVSITPERLFVRVTNIRVGKNIYPVSLSAYDLDGMQGINLPPSIQAEISQRAKGAVVEEGIDENIAGSGVVGKVVSSVGRAAKSVFSKSTQEIKVEVKSNYALLLQ